MQLVFEQIRTGGDRNFGYLFGDRDAKQAVLIDPSFSPDAMIERAKVQELEVTHIINTHGHHDHTNGNERALSVTKARLAAHVDAESKPDLMLVDGGRIKVGAFELTVAYTPGHLDDHIILYEPQFELLITGDLMFVGKVGSTDDDKAARVEYNSLQRVLSDYPNQATIWPGHDYGVRPSSTLQMEKATNPFLRCADLMAFLRLKDDWPIFKKLHGLK